MPKCSIEECRRPSRAKGLCDRHRYRQRRYGDPLATRVKQTSATGICTIEGCERPHASFGYCSKHLNRFKSNGDPNIVRDRSAEARATMVERFWALVEKTDSCWIYNGTHDHYGYGMVNFTQAPTRKAHRYSFYLTHGRMPEKDLLHTCDRPDCVNPDHLREGTMSENMADKFRKGRQARGVVLPHAKLNPEKVREIRKIAGQKSDAQIGEMFGVNRKTIAAIRTGMNWRHVT